jgi:hypothetical protein
MTLRRDKDVVNDACVAALRMEPALAQHLCAEAIRLAPRVVHRLTKGDVAEFARSLLRRGLGWTHQQSEVMEATELKPKRLGGLVLEAPVHRRLHELAGKHFNGNVASATRHLLRVGLGMAVEESLQREEKFASLAAALREVREAHQG